MKRRVETTREKFYRQRHNYRASCDRETGCRAEYLQEFERFEPNYRNYAIGIKHFLRHGLTAGKESRRNAVISIMRANYSAVRHAYRFKSKRFGA